MRFGIRSDGGLAPVRGEHCRRCGSFVAKNTTWATVRSLERLRVSRRGVHNLPVDSINQPSSGSRPTICAERSEGRETHPRPVDEQDGYAQTLPCAHCRDATTLAGCGPRQHDEQCDPNHIVRRCTSYVTRSTWWSSRQISPSHIRLAASVDRDVNTEIDSGDPLDPVGSPN
jgi:hypothetical protein